MTRYQGWYQVAFTEGLATPLASRLIGSQRLLLLSDPSGRVCAFDGDCPHRGADLALGNLDDDCIVCPFHGHRIHLGENPERRFRVREHDVLSLSGIIFVRLNGGEDLGFVGRMRDLDRRCWIVPGFEMSLRAAHELVAENAFDGAHFHSVHQVQNHPRVEVSNGEAGELVGTGVLEVPPSTWQRSPGASSNVAVPITVRAYSPGVVVTDMGGMHPYAVITTATPTEDGCTVRLSFCMPRTPGADGPDRRLCEYMIAQARKGLEADKIIWESLAWRHTPHYTPEDSSVIAYRKFCAQFEPATD